MSQEHPREDLREPAAAWHDRVNRDHVSEETRRELVEWLAQSPQHRAAYEAIDHAWAALQSAAQDPQLLALRHETALRLTRRTSSEISPLRWAAVAVVLIALGTVAAVFLPRASGEHLSLARLLAPSHTGTDGRYATVTGERSTVTLSDGSTVTLDTQSEIQIAFAKSERLARLDRGQAIFEVTKDPARPFVVEVHHRRFVAVGTAFDVRLDGAEIKVTMIEGTVRVEREGTPEGRPQAVPGSGLQSHALGGSGTARTEPDLTAASSAIVTTLTAGEQLTVDAESQDHVRPADADQVTSWRRGQVIFDNTRLGDAVAELNRYSERKIGLADPQLADLRLSGAFATGRPSLFIEAVTAYFPLRVASADDRAVILSARK